MNEVTVMIIKTATCLALAAACLSTVPVALAQTGGQTVVSEKADIQIKQDGGKLVLLEAGVRTVAAIPPAAA